MRGFHFATFLFSRFVSLPLARPVIHKMQHLPRQNRSHPSTYHMHSCFAFQFMSCHVTSMASLHAMPRQEGADSAGASSAVPLGLHTHAHSGTNSKTKQTTPPSTRLISNAPSTRLISNAPCNHCTAQPHHLNQPQQKKSTALPNRSAGLLDRPFLVASSLNQSITTGSPHLWSEPANPSEATRCWRP